jgi:parallel beta-helix repeat protein
LENSSQTEIYLQYSNNNNIFDNTANTSGYTADFDFRHSSNNNITNNILSSSGNVDGMDIYEASENNTLINNTVNVIGSVGIYLEGSGHVLIGNNVSSNSNFGIYVYSANNNTITNNTASSNGREGISLYSSSNNTITNNTANSNDEFGFYIVYASSSNNISNSNSYDNTLGGYYFSADSNGNFGCGNQGNKTDEGNNTGFNSSACGGATTITRFNLILKNMLTAPLYLSSISLDGQMFNFSPAIYFPPAQSRLVSFNISGQMCEYPGQLLEFEKVILFYKQGAIENIAQAGSIPLVMRCS